MSAPKFDPALLRERERDKEREKEKLAYTGSSMTSQPQSQSHGNHLSGGPGSKEIEGYVGFANLPNQVYRKSVKRGFEFTLMVVGKYEMVYETRTMIPSHQYKDVILQRSRRKSKTKN